ncbi:MAG: hypothetical protein K0S74_1403 [Chlamydiales bacterium]|jgi:hypothetical protein|nr:hypothetical protein [Chlamydiales bacterium]
MDFNNMICDGQLCGDVPKPSSFKAEDINKESQLHTKSVANGIFNNYEDFPQGSAVLSNSKKCCNTAIPFPDLYQDYKLCSSVKMDLANITYEGLNERYKADLAEAFMLKQVVCRFNGNYHFTLQGNSIGQVFSFVKNFHRKAACLHARLENGLEVDKDWLVDLFDRQDAAYFRWLYLQMKTNNGHEQQEMTSFKNIASDQFFADRVKQFLNLSYKDPIEFNIQDRSTVNSYFNSSEVAAFILKYQSNIPSVEESAIAIIKKSPTQYFVYDTRLGLYFFLGSSQLAYFLSSESNKLETEINHGKECILLKFEMLN